MAKPPRKGAAPKGGKPNKGPKPMQQKKAKAPKFSKTPSAPAATGVVSTKGKGRKRPAPAAAPAPALGGRKALKVTTVRGGELTESVKLWNIFRAKALDPTKRQKAVAAALGALKGKLYEASLKHDAARVVQALIKWGDAAQRAAVQAELAPRVADLARMPYARHVALCLLRHARGDPGRAVYSALKGKFSKVAAHANGAKVADAALSVVSATDARALRAELLGPDAALLLASRGRDRPPSLKDVLAENAARRGAVLDGVDRVARKLIDKALGHHAFAQDLLFEYCDACSFDEDGGRLRDLAGHCADAAAHVVATRRGALAVATLATASDAKTRKRLLKQWKGRVAAAATHAHARLALLKCVDVVDDTVASGKLLTSELAGGAVPALLDLALDPQGAKLLLYVLAGPGATKYFDPTDLEVLGDDPASVTVAGAPASKKPRDRRRDELRAALLPALTKLASKFAPALLGSRSGGAVLVETLRRADGGDVAARVARACLGGAFDAEVTETADPALKPKHFGGGDEDEDEDDDDDPFGAADADGGDASDSDSSSGGDDDDGDAAAAFDDDDDDEDDDEEEEDDSSSESDDEDGGAAVAPAAGPPPILEHDVAHRTLLTLLQRDGGGAFAAAFADATAGRLAAWAASNRGALVCAALVKACPAAKAELSSVVGPSGSKGGEALAKALKGK